MAIAAIVATELAADVLAEAARLELPRHACPRRCIPLESLIVDLRYKDCPIEAELAVPVRSAFVAMKHLAWTGRAAARDLVDLAGLAAIGAFDSEADRTVACLRGFGVQSAELEVIPEQTRRSWIADLVHQIGEPPEPDGALDEIRNTWADSLNWQ